MFVRTRSRFTHSPRSPLPSPSITPSLHLLGALSTPQISHPAWGLEPPEVRCKLCSWQLGGSRRTLASLQNRAWAQHMNGSELWSSEQETKHCLFLNVIHQPAFTAAQNFKSKAVHPSPRRVKYCSRVVMISFGIAAAVLAYPALQQQQRDFQTLPAWCITPRSARGEKNTSSK